MNRLSQIPIKYYNNKKIYKNIIYPIIEKEENDTYILAKVTDRLDELARKHYGDSNLFWIIARTNTIYDSLFVNPGTQICIPHPSRLSKIIQDFIKLNNM